MVDKLWNYTGGWRDSWIVCRQWLLETFDCTSAVKYLLLEKQRRNGASTAKLAENIVRNEILYILWIRILLGCLLSLSTSKELEQDKMMLERHIWKESWMLPVGDLLKRQFWESCIDLDWFCTIDTANSSGSFLTIRNKTHMERNILWLCGTDPSVSAVVRWKWSG